MKPTQKDLANDLDWITGTGQGCSGTSNPGGTRKPGNPIKGARNLAPNRNRISGCADQPCRHICRKLIHIVNLSYGVHIFVMP